MTGSAGRRKGADGEREAARVSGGRRTSRIGVPSPDIVDRWGTPWEVKRRKNKLRIVYEWLNQNPDWPRVMARDDRQPWVVIMFWDEYEQLKRKAEEQ